MAVARVVEVPVHHAHLEAVHDAVEEDVVELDAVPVTHPLVVLQRDSHCHGGSIVWVFRLELSFVIYKGEK